MRELRTHSKTSQPLWEELMLIQRRARGGAHPSLAGGQLRLVTHAVRSLCLLSLLLLSLSPEGGRRWSCPSAQAQQGGDAQRLAQAASAAFDAGNYAEAAEKYQAAITLLPHPVLYVNLSKALSALSRNRDALAACEQALATEIVADPETRAAAERCISRFRGERDQLSVSLESRPPGASLRIDGRVVGTTPWSGRLPPGRRQFDLSLAGHHPATRVIQGEPGQQVRLRVQLIPVGLGAVLSLVSDPPGAQVSINGEYVGPAPLRGLQLPSGAHQLELSLPGYQVLQKRIQLHEGETRSLALFLGSQSGERATPWPVWGFLGAGGVLSLLGGYFGYEALHARNEARSLALTSRLQSDQGRYDGYRQSMENYRTTSDILWISSGVLISGGLIWWLVDANSDPSPPAATDEAERETTSGEAPAGFFD